MKKATLLLVFLLLSCIPAPHIKNIDPVEQAYAVQKDRVVQSKQTVVGYKAGLTSKAGQSKFSVSEPVAGVLFKDGLSHNRQVYLLDDYQKLMLETEIGFILNKDMPSFASFPSSVEFAASMVEQVVPVIELPDLAYPDMSKVTGLTLIESNVASNQVLIGKGKPLSAVNLNSINTHLNKNGQTVISGKATDAMDDQLKALHWLMSRLYSQGYQLKKGDLLITGALGKMVAAERGQYDADFGELGQLSFSIR